MVLDKLDEGSMRAVSNHVLKVTSSVHPFGPMPLSQTIQDQITEWLRSYNQHPEHDYETTAYLTNYAKDIFDQIIKP